MPLSDKITKAVQVSKAHVQWLTSMANKHSLQDKDKAFRCCVNFAAQTGLRLEQEHASPPKLEEETTLSATEGQWLFLDESGSSVASFIGQCKSLTVKDEDLIFQVVRCKTKTNGTLVPAIADETTPCEGAQEALAARKACGCEAKEGS